MTGSMGKFALLIHPRNEADYQKHVPFVRHLPRFVFGELKNVLPPLLISEIKGIQSSFARAEGDLVFSPFTKDCLAEIPSELVWRKVVQAIGLAKKRGVKLVGLDDGVSFPDSEGLKLWPHTDMAVTTGAHYALYVMLQELKGRIKMVNAVAGVAKIVIWGAVGSVGNICARLLARENQDLILFAPERGPLEKLAERILYETGLAVKIVTTIGRILAGADIVVVANCPREIILEPQDLKKGAVIYNLGYSHNLFSKIKDRRKDISLFQRAFVTVPGLPESNFGFGFPPGQYPAGWAEAIILALENRCESFSRGSGVTSDKVKEIGALAQKHGFALGCVC